MGDIIAPPDRDATTASPINARLNWFAMTRAQKVLLVVAGYVGALLAAWLVFEFSGLASDPNDPNVSGGMAAFGDGILFVGTFLLASVAPTILGFYFLRRAPRIWSFAFAAAILAPLLAGAAWLFGAFG